MLKEYATILEAGTDEIVEKKSRFIGNVRHVETEEEAISFVNEMKKKYYDARHNCYAYVIGEENIEKSRKLAESLGATFICRSFDEGR